MAQTLSTFLESQSSLVQEAAEALPHQFSQCTYPLGHIRQAVYLCLTCEQQRGICAACSIACHTDHEQLELFPKRNFRCDCPTSALSHSCTLHKTLEDVNTGNIYGRNFAGVFCRCGREYDAQKEKETMIQCLACEDWFHESCLNLRERPSSREASPERQHNVVQAVTEEDDDAHSIASSSGRPPPLITASCYDAFICGACVRSCDTVRRWAGTPGVLMVVRDDRDTSWKVVGVDAASDELDVGVTEDATIVTGAKRARSGSPVHGPQLKRSRASGDVVATSSNPCLAPPVNSFAQSLLSSLDAGTSTPSLGAGDVFLTEGWRGRWCRCDSCLPSLQARPYLLQEEETYEPPEDPDSGLSLEELGMRALERLPRDRALDGIRAFNEMRDQLMSHLRPFAEEGKEVTEADIRAFFDEKMAAAAK